ncbi:MAG: nuclease-related domain-containing protein [Nitrospira sp.]|nr:nuclease-related domain-containing protein [Nitrospira sp.]
MATIYGEPQAVYELRRLLKKESIKTFTSIEQIKSTDSFLRIQSQHPYICSGAQGEEQVAGQLSKLPDDYTVIHNYNLEFPRPLYDRRNDDRIYSVQIDHLVIGPTGLYLIETKHWSKTSQENRNFFSPVKQLKRCGFALFVLLNQAIEKRHISGFAHHWGERQISPQKILCFLRHAPSERFQHVTILSPQRLTYYIRHQEQLFSRQQMESLVEYLLESGDIPESPSSKFSVAPNDSAGPGCLASIGWLLVLFIPIFLMTVWGIAGTIGAMIFEYVRSCFNPHGCPPLW